MSLHPFLHLRDVLVPLIQSRGRNPLPAPWDKWVPVLSYELLDSNLVLLGPCAMPPDGRSFFVLEVRRAGQEVFCLKWDEAGASEVLAHVPGPWEADFFLSNPTEPEVTQ